MALSDKLSMRDELSVMHSCSLLVALRTSSHTSVLSSSLSAVELTRPRTLDSDQKSGGHTHSWTLSDYPRLSTPPPSPPDHSLSALSSLFLTGSRCALDAKFNPRPGHSGFSDVGIVPDDVVGQRVFSGISRFPLSFLRCSILTSITLIDSQELENKIGEFAPLLFSMCLEIIPKETLRSWVLPQYKALMTHVSRFPISHCGSPPNTLSSAPGGGRLSQPTFAFEAEKRWSNKGDATALIKCAIAATREILNWRAAFLSYQALIGERRSDSSLTSDAISVECPAGVRGIRKDLQQPIASVRLSCEGAGSSTEYTVQEYCVMYRTLGEFRNNANAAARLYRERGIVVVIARVPASSEGWINGHENRGKLFLGRAHAADRRKSSSNVRKGSQLELITGLRLGVSHSLVLTILHDDGVYHYRYSAIHHLMEGERPRRLEYCQGML
ncbi:hypothetical protein PR048_008023 [Dryococelus australis]|uniref:Uncharacterized protein n=1 Tax=Dryococelus australis TaxID=614101 RepID=A0ABQ9HW86_9NEOP|nr:hypothetical protein PR048_008023 [Dryococelus australis]